MDTEGTKEPAQTNIIAAHGAHGSTAGGLRAEGMQINLTSQRKNY